MLFSVLGQSDITWLVSKVFGLIDVNPFILSIAKCTLISSVDLGHDAAECSIWSESKLVALNKLTTEKKKIYKNIRMEPDIQTAEKFGFSKVQGTPQPVYNTVCYNMVLDITQFKDGSQKCIDYIEKWP